MGLRDIKDLDRDDVADFVWKWRCKMLPNQESTIPKTADLDSLDDDDPRAKAEKAGAQGKDPGLGSDATVKTMYEGRNSNGCNFDWVDYPPKQISKSAARAQDRVSIKAYKIKDREKPCIGGRHPLRYHEIEVQNPQLVAALEPIVKRENVHLDVNESASFSHPFRALWFCQDEITELYKKTESSDQRKTHLNVLVRLMDDMFQELRQRARHLKASGLVDYKNAWILFPKDSTVYSHGLNSEFLVKVDSTYYVTRSEGDFLIIKGKIMAFNGEEFVWQDKLLAIKKFSGNKPVTELDSFPLEFHSEAAAIKTRCIRRGKKMLDYQGLTYCCYNGIALHHGQDTSKHNVEGRVLIDVMGYNKYHLAQGSRENQDDNDKNRAGRGRRRRPPEEPDEEGEAVKVTQKSRLSDEEQVTNKNDMLSREDDLGYMSELIGGYALKNKIWVQFYVEDLQPMVWNDHAFEHLVYDAQQKDLVLSFVENHNTQFHNGGAKSSNMEDVIRGKGNGLILLLSGPPGTGKTLTAEAVADRTHRPLFYLQAEDLGINAASLGANIKRVFEMATDWDAVILLDEADVFMAERNPNDIHRNELVSIFLRELEYFRGIIFLTTNLYHTIDSAFRSRVNLHLLFQALSKEARETVWRKFLDRMPEARALPPTEDPASAENRPLDDDDIKQLGLWQLNGREIKNAVKMVRSWCDHKGYVLTLERLENGIKVTSPHASKDGDVDGDLYE